MIRCLCLHLCLIDDLSQSRHTQNLSHSFALNSIWPHTQDSKDNRIWEMNTHINIQKQGERNSQEIDYLQISDDDASKSAFKSPRSFPWVSKLWRSVSCHQSPPTTSSYLSTTHSAPSIQLLNIINHVKQTSNGHWHQQKKQPNIISGQIGQLWRAYTIQNKSVGLFVPWNDTISQWEDQFRNVSASQVPSFAYNRKRGVLGFRVYNLPLEHNQKFS